MRTEEPRIPFEQALEEFLHQYGASGCLERQRKVFKTLITGGYVDLSRKERHEMIGFCEALYELLGKLAIRTNDPS